MNLIIAIIVTMALPVAVSISFGKYAPLAMIALISLSAIWVLIDVERMKFEEYDVFYISSPVIMSILVLLLWVVGFAIFLTAWLSIFRGTAKRKIKKFETFEVK